MINETTHGLQSQGRRSRIGVRSPPFSLTVKPRTIVIHFVLSLGVPRRVLQFMPLKGSTAHETDRGSHADCFTAALLLSILVCRPNTPSSEGNPVQDQSVHLDIQQIGRAHV